MLTVLAEHNSRKLGGNTFLIPFEETWLATRTCRELLQFVLASHLKQPDLLSTVEHVKMFCVKQHEFVQSGSSTSKKEIANTTACIDYKAIFVIESFSALSFHFKLVSQPTIEHAASSRAQVNPFSLMMNSHANCVFLPLLLNHDRMYSNHDLYNELIEFLRKHKLGWTPETVSTFGKRFVDGMSRASFQCGPSVWKALNYKCGALFLFLIQ